MNKLPRVLNSLQKCSRRILPVSIISLNNTKIIARGYCQKSETKAELVVPSYTSDHDDQQYEQNVKDHILSKALDFVPTYGWSVESLTQGAEAAGYPGITHGLFPNGSGDLIHYFNVKCNENLVEQMKSWPKEDLKDLKVPVQFIENAIVSRLLMIQPYKCRLFHITCVVIAKPFAGYNFNPGQLFAGTAFDCLRLECLPMCNLCILNRHMLSTWPKAMAIQALPNNVPNSLATLLSLVDDICYHSGDRSVDFNWYIRRVGLAGIYKASELFYLTDNSQDSSATRSFVKSRIRDAELIQTALNLNPVSVAPQTLTAAFVTAKNMLGLNTLK